MNEQETRTEYILPALRKAGWGIVQGSRIREEFPISKGRLMGAGQRSKPDKADYVLQYRNRNLAVIEAKRKDADFTEGVAQAKDYASKLQIRYSYSTNGLRLYCMDMQEGTEGEIAVNYPTPDELWEMVNGDYEKENINSNEWIRKFDAIPFETKSGLKPPRYYQENAINNVLKRIAEKEDRILLTLATGTGKTAIAFQIAWKLFKAKWNLKGDGQRSPRILFLADRNLLADQAYSSFNEYNAFEEDALVRIRPNEVTKKGRVPTNGNIFFTIFQSFVSENNGATNFGQYPKDFFDFIVIDECHRGGAKDESSWRAIMEYFSPAVQLGLTATPKRIYNTDTYKYFGEPVYVYSLKEGINDGFLTPFKVKEISTTGDEYVYTSDDEIIEGEVEDGKTYTQSEQNRVIELMDVERYRVQLLMNAIDQNQKTIVFCATQAHALAIRNLINQISTSKNPDYCHRVTADDGKLGEQHLKDFQNNEKQIPTILTTSQKLSTGVDAPEIRNIVLMRPINTMIEFKQIIGRGTRLFDGKDYFTIYDFVNAHHHFQDAEWDGEPVDPVEPKERPKSTPLPHTEFPPLVEEPEPPRRMLRIKLADGKVRELQHMVKTKFYSPDGKPISAEEFLQSMFGIIPELFKSEDELRKIWSKPDTRKRLLEELADKGFAK
ncbi:MAG: DEAD/DEAH box helicase family protein, partial [Bacteroidetes bacterium]|nr:DEAD/DEAH box helicase family protein [Bacteroidota bacterium]